MEIKTMKWFVLAPLTIIIIAAVAASLAIFIVTTVETFRNVRWRRRGARGIPTSDG